ncbi:pseudouridylate synthase 7 homolog [Eurosta solidaginis]|uniref:pseudouridylate synthase 7 homolog n=1 Tax=Eurosta solidaginis TaxID=178769 RepID=UPI003530C280
MGRNRRTPAQKRLINKARAVLESMIKKNKPSKPRIRRPPSSSFKKFGTSGANFEFKTPNPKPRENKRTRMYLREEQVGITQFLTEGSGFFGVVKSKMNDFLINEIDANGKVSQFNNLTVPMILEENRDEGEQTERPAKWNFPGEYVHFLVFLENVTTSEAVLKLASEMGLHPSEISYSSTKGRNVKIVQKFCIKRRNPSDIASAAQNCGIRAGNFEIKNEELKLGDSKGDRVRIALRYVRGNQKIIETSLENIREHGFINYFGLQRFGHHQGTPTHDVGVALLKSDYKTAVELILKPHEHDLPFMIKIRKLWWETRDAAAAAAIFRMDDFVEKKLLDGLIENNDDYALALKSLPRNNLLLYSASFQSLVFNIIASRRFEKFRKQLLPGDFVYFNKDELDEYIVEYAEIPEYIVSKDAELEDMNDIENAGAALNEKIKTLTEEDIASGEYTIYDVVMPLLGFNIMYPDNEIGTWYEEIFEKYGLSHDDLQNSCSFHSLAGSYRKFLIRPNEFTWSNRKYSQPYEYLLSSDWDHIIGKAAEIDKLGNNGDSTAILLDFCLPRSVYVPVLLRELLKMDKSAAITTTVIR